MPKGFTDQEKIDIDKALRMEGKQLFETQGFRKTSVQDITEAVGIAKGSFYLFYGSKEELFLTILEHIESHMHGQIANQLMEASLPMADRMKQMWRTQFQVMAKEPILRQTLEPGLMERIWRKISKEKQADNIQKDVDFVDQLKQLAPPGSLMAKMAPETLAGLFRSLVFLQLHEAEIGQEAYPQVLDFHIEAMVDRLFGPMSSEPPGRQD